MKADQIESNMNRSINLTRRDVLKSTACGFGMLALAGLCADESLAAKTNPLSPKQPHFAPRAKRVIFLCMRGGPSHMETFDYKPKLNADHGKPSKRDGQKWFGSQWAFRQYGESGSWVSDLMQQTAAHADDLCLLNGMHCDSPEHGAGLTQLHTGSIQFHRPSIGSWYSMDSDRRAVTCPALFRSNRPSSWEGPAITVARFCRRFIRGRRSAQ